MKFIFGIVGLVLGAAMGGPFAALVGLVLGVGLAFFIQTNQPQAANTASKAEDDDPLSPKRLGERIARLEKDLAALRTQLSNMSGAPQSAASTPVAPAPAVVPTPATAPASTPAFAAEHLVPLAPQMAVPAQPPLDTAALAELAPAQQQDFSDTWPAEFEESTPAQVQAPSTPIAASTASAASPQLAARPALAPQPELSLQDRLPPFVRDLIFGGNTIVKIGVLILFLGLAFLLRYAAERVTVPVELYYASVALLGAALLILGWRLRERKDASGQGGYGLVLQGAGIGVLYLTTLAALKLSQLLPPELAFGFLFVVAVLSALLAVAQNAPWLAYVAAAEGFAAPVLVSTGSGNHIALFSYLAILDIGIFLVAWFRAWRPLNLIGFIGTCVLAGAWAHSGYTDAHYASAQGFLVFFFLLFTFIGVLFARRALALDSAPDAQQPLEARAAKALASVGRVDSALVFGVPLTCFGLQYGLVQGLEFGPAWAAVAFALFYLVLGGGLMRGGNVRYALLGEAYVIVAVIFGTLAIPLALEGQWTGATWAIEAAGMYWLGLRQRRMYTRAFATLVLGAATVRLVTALGVDLAPGTPLLVGSSLSMLMLGVSGLVMYITGYRFSLSPRAEWERGAAALHLWAGMGAVASIAWLLLVTLWASVVTALLALVCALLCRRVRSAALQTACVALHAAAVAGWVSTLHQVPGQPMLSNGWQGLVAAVLIGLSLLASVLLPLLAAVREARARQQAPEWSLASYAGLLAGLALLSLSLLFVMPAEDAARIWPWLGVAALWLGLRLGHPALSVGWGALQLGAGYAFLSYGPNLWADHSAVLTAWTPLGLTLAALVSGDWIQRAAKEQGTELEKETQFGGVVGQWVVVLWSLGWWSAVLLPDMHRYLVSVNLTAYGVWWQVLAGWVLVTSVLAALVARARDWRVLGQTTWATVPEWALLAWLTGGMGGQGPHAYVGWLVWPAALVWHVVLLRMQPRWLSHAKLELLHVGGFLTFVFLATLEMHWCMLALGDAASAWPLLGAVLVPALALVLVSRPVLLKRWPLSEFERAYVQWASAPLALYLLIWLWGSNATSGTAAPLPYVPLVNPLEIGHGFALLALALWARARWQRLGQPLVAAVLGATALALYSGMVLRACHHFAGVAWNESALYDSTLAQAALSVAWSLVGVVLMLLGARRVHRGVWAAGAGLLGVVVLKLFFIELADTGGVYRIVSFMVVGLLLLVVGYFAPVPPTNKKAALPKEDAHESV